MKTFLKSKVSSFVGIINNNNLKVPEKYAEEFMEESVITNIHRLRSICAGLIFMSIVLIIFDILQLRNFEHWDAEYVRIHLGHGVLLTLLIVYSIILAKCEKGESKDIRELQRVSYSFILSLLALSVFLSVSSQMLHGEIFAFLIAVLYVSSALVLNIKEFGGLYVASYLVFIVGMFVFHENMDTVSSNIINSFFITATAVIGSSISYSYYVSNFINKRIIAEKNAELESTKNQLEAEVIRRTEELMKAKEIMQYEKLRTEFFANVSHELRTPLNVIFCAEQLIESSIKNKEADLGVKIDKYSSTVKQNCYRLIRLIGNLIDITKLDAGNFEICMGNYDIVKVVEDITLSVAGYVENKGIELTFDTEVEEKVIACDPDKVERIILNLLSNSVKFTEQGGQIIISIYTRDGSVIISVKDTGEGIPFNKQSTIFERFVQVDKSISRKREGSGIGLSLVKSLVEMQGGTISLKSEYKKGSEFIIELRDEVIQVAENLCCSDSNANTDNIERIRIEFSDIYM